MEQLIRLLLRFFIVPAGFLAATIVGSLVIMIASWQLVSVAMSGRPDAPADALVATVLGGTILLPFVLVMALLPASIGILISEGFPLLDLSCAQRGGVGVARLEALRADRRPDHPA